MPDTLPGLPSFDSIAKEGEKAQAPQSLLFKQHLLQSGHSEPIPIIKESHFISGLLIWTSVALVILAFARHPKKFRLWTSAIFSLSSARTLEREDFKSVRLPSFALSLVYLISLTLFITQYNSNERLFFNSISSPLQLVLVFSFVLLFQMVKFTVHLLFGSLAVSGRSAAEYNFNLLLSAQATGLFLLPVVVCILFLNAPLSTFFVVGFGVLTLFFLTRIIKGLGIVFGNGEMSVFHVFLYLCAVEMLPLLVIYRFIFN
jgi:hypothetical protein